VAWQSTHISTATMPSTLLNGPVVEPQKEQRAAIRITTSVQTHVR
jgi:hypothetical protein